MKIELRNPDGGLIEVGDGDSFTVRHRGAPYRFTWNTGNTEERQWQSPSGTALPPSFPDDGDPLELSRSGELSEFTVRLTSDGFIGVSDDESEDSSGGQGPGGGGLNLPPVYYGTNEGLSIPISGDWR